MVRKTEAEAKQKADARNHVRPLLGGPKAEQNVEKATGSEKQRLSRLVRGGTELRGRVLSIFFVSLHRATRNEKRGEEDWPAREPGSHCCRDRTNCGTNPRGAPRRESLLYKKKKKEREERKNLREVGVTVS